MKILIANSYSLDIIYKEWIEGKSPSHFMFGKIELEKYHNIKVDIVPFENWKIINRLGKILRFSNLDQELWMLLRLRKYDLIYATFGTGNTRLISFLKIFGLINTPIVMLAHQNLYTPKSDKFGIKKKILLNYDRVLFFSRELLKKTQKDLALNNFSELSKFKIVNWGPDESYYNKGVSLKASESSFAICAGTTDRDFDLIIDAFHEIDFPLEIYCTPQTRPTREDIPSHISINSSFIPYADLLERYQKARFILIPIKNEKVQTGRTLGLTVILDAIAIGKPVIMTHNDYVDLINPEKNGFGINVHENSVEAWVSAISNILNDYQKLDQMSQNGQEVYLGGYNTTSFADELILNFKELIENK